jgi:hypothetical protein
MPRAARWRRRRHLQQCKHHVEGERPRRPGDSRPRCSPATVAAVAGTGTPATALLARQKVEHRLLAYPHRGGQAYGPEAARRSGSTRRGCSRRWSPRWTGR